MDQQQPVPFIHRKVTLRHVAIMMGVLLVIGGIWLWFYFPTVNRVEVGGPIAQTYADVGRDGTLHVKFVASDRSETLEYEFEVDRDEAAKLRRMFTAFHRTIRSLEFNGSTKSPTFSFYRGSFRVGRFTADSEGRYGKFVTEFLDFLEAREHVSVEERKHIDEVRSRPGYWP